MSTELPFIEVSLVIDAPIAKVFEAWTNAELLEQWQTQKATVDARQGGKFRFESGDVEDMPGLHVVTGEYIEFVAGEKLVADWVYVSPEEDEEPIASRVTTLFKDLGDGQTEVTVIEACETHDDEEEADFAIEAWSGALEELAEIFED